MPEDSLSELGEAAGRAAPELEVGAGDIIFIGFCILAAGICAGFYLPRLWRAAAALTG